jgi:hypothetical protein
MPRLAIFSVRPSHFPPKAVLYIQFFIPSNNQTNGQRNALVNTSVNMNMDIDDNANNEEFFDATSFEEQMNEENAIEDNESSDDEDDEIINLYITSATMSQQTALSKRLTMMKMTLKQNGELDLDQVEHKIRQEILSGHTSV